MPFVTDTFHREQQIAFAGRFGPYNAAVRTNAMSRSGNGIRFSRSSLAEEATMLKRLGSR